VPPPLNIAFITEVIFSTSVFVMNNGDEGGLDFTRGFMKEYRLIVKNPLKEKCMNGYSEMSVNNSQVLQ